MNFLEDRKGNKRRDYDENIYNDGLLSEIITRGENEFEENKGILCNIFYNNSNEIDFVKKSILYYSRNNVIDRKEELDVLAVEDELKNKLSECNEEDFDSIVDIYGNSIIIPNEGVVYSYIYDEKCNWIHKTIFVAGRAIGIVERQIEYYD